MHQLQNLASKRKNLEKAWLSKGILQGILERIREDVNTHKKL